MTLRLLMILDVGNNLQVSNTLGTKDILVNNNIKIENELEVNKANIQKLKMKKNLKLIN